MSTAYWSDLHHDFAFRFAAESLRHQSSSGEKVLDTDIDPLSGTGALKSQRLF